MNQRKLIVLFALCLYGCNSTNKPKKMQSKSNKIVIAHRGASGYLPEHTLASKAMAYAMRPDFLEQDLVLSKDDIPIVIHDIQLETVTDVASKFVDKKRADGHYYVVDFTYAELLQLNVTERFDPKTDKAVYKNRFPLNKSTFKLHSLQDEIELIQGLNKSTGNNIGIYPEIKDPAFHHNEGKDISKIVLEVLRDYGYANKDDNCILQCFDAKALKRIREELGSELFLVQLIEGEEAKEDTEVLLGVVDGIGPWYKETSSELVRWAHDKNLKVHAYTFRADDLGEFKSFDALLNYGFNTLGLDGVFTDFPDKAVDFVEINY